MWQCFTVIYLVWHIDGEIEAFQFHSPVDGPARGELLLQLGMERLRRTDNIRHVVASVPVVIAFPPRAEAASSSAVVIVSGLPQQLYIALALAEGKAIHIHKVGAILSCALVVYICS